MKCSVLKMNQALVLLRLDKVTKPGAYYSMVNREVEMCQCGVVSEEKNIKE